MRIGTGNPYVQKIWNRVGRYRVILKVTGEGGRSRKKKGRNEFTTLHWLRRIHKKGENVANRSRFSRTGAGTGEEEGKRGETCRIPSPFKKYVPFRGGG